MPTTKKGLVLEIKLLVHKASKLLQTRTKVLSKTIIYNTLSARHVSTYIKKNRKQNLFISENKDDLKVIESE